MKTVNFLYGRTTFDLEVPDDTPVLTSNVDALKSDKDGYETPQQVHILEHHRVAQTADHAHTRFLRQCAND